nr:putative cell division protein [Streptococcus thermophilus]
MPVKKIVGAAAALLILAAVAWAVIYFTPAMTLKNVVAEGNQHVTDEEIAAATGVEPGVPLAQVDTREAAAGVASLPWVKSATASRSWPSTLKLKVEENAAVAFIKGSEGAKLIDAEGREFAVDTPPDTAVELTGEMADEKVRKDAVDIAASLSDTAKGAVKSVEARSKYDFVLHLKDKIVVWGASEDNENKSLALDTVLQREGREFNVSNPQQITSK